METYQKNRCGCDLLISSSNSQVESLVLQSQMTLTKLTGFPLRSSTWLSSKSIGPLQPKLEHPRLPTHEMDQRHTSSIVTRGTPGGDLPTKEAKQSHKPQAQSFSRSNKGQETKEKASSSGEPFPHQWFVSPSGINDLQP